MYLHLMMYADQVMTGVLIWHALATLMVTLSTDYSEHCMQRNVPLMSINITVWHATVR